MLNVNIALRIFNSFYTINFSSIKLYFCKLNYKYYKHASCCLTAHKVARKLKKPLYKCLINNFH